MNATPTNRATALSSRVPPIGWNRSGFYRAGVGRPRLAEREARRFGSGVSAPSFSPPAGRTRTRAEDEQGRERRNSRRGGRGDRPSARLLLLLLLLLLRFQPRRPFARPCRNTTLIDMTSHPRRERHGVASSPVLRFLSYNLSCKIATGCR